MQPGDVIAKIAQMKFDGNLLKKDVEACAICMDQFKEGQEITPLPCNDAHYFHSECIGDWFDSNQTCPMCRQPITEEAMKEQKDKYDALIEE